ncbi:hypothetical protein K438DRAFT_1755522 [Mycena galopus ATCC 62051]|nr:hypothetical protein K438DRAFT_1755522 [Mycena galopus ATCC 62051]
MTERQQPFLGGQKGGPGWTSGGPEEGTRRPIGTMAPGGSRNTTLGTEGAPCCYSTQTSDPTRQLWRDQREQGPRTGSAFRPKKRGGTDTESPVFSTGWENPNKFSKTPTTDPGTPGTARPYHDLFQGKGATMGNAGTGARNLNPKGEGYPGTPGSIPVGPRNRNLAQEQAEARPNTAPGTMGPEATGRGQPKTTHPKKHARIPAHEKGLLLGPLAVIDKIGGRRPGRTLAPAGTRTGIPGRNRFALGKGSQGVVDTGGNSAEFWRAVGLREENPERIIDRQQRNADTEVQTKEGAFHTQLAKQNVELGVSEKEGTHHKKEKGPPGFCDPAIRILRLPPSSEAVLKPQTHFIQTNVQRFGEEARETGAGPADLYLPVHVAPDLDVPQAQGCKGEEMLMSQLRHRPIERVGCQIALEPMEAPRFVKCPIGQDMVEDGEERRRDNMNGPCPREHSREGRVRGIQKETQTRVPSKGEIVEDRQHEGEEEKRILRKKGGNRDRGTGSLNEFRTRHPCFRDKSLSSDVIEALSGFWIGK